MDYYDKDVISYIDPTIVLNPFFDEWFNIVKDILLNDEFQKRKIFPHHHNMSVWDHSVLVSFRSFIMAKSFNTSESNCAIAGLLHDFYPWCWMNTPELEEFENGKYLEENKRKKKSIFEMHAFTHGKAAVENYIKYFPELENKRINNAIKTHMFPLTLPPRYLEGVIVTTIDKFNSLSELPSPRVIPSKLKKQFNDKVYLRIKNYIKVK